MQEIKSQAEHILNNYCSMKNEIRALEFELDRTNYNLNAATIEGAVFTRSGYEMVSSSNISDKTANIAVEHVAGQRDGKYFAITILLHHIRSEVKRIEYYLSLLLDDEADVIRRFYFDKLTLAEISGHSGKSQRTIQRRKKNGVDKLIFYYSIRDGLNTSVADIEARIWFIGYIHQERFEQLLALAGENNCPGIKAMLYIISGCNEAWRAGIESFIDLSTGEIQNYGDSIKAFSQGGKRLVQLACHLGYGLERENLLSVLGRYFSGLEHVHLELAIEAVKMVRFPYYR